MMSDQPRHCIVKSCTYHPYKLTAAVKFLSKNVGEMKPGISREIIKSIGIETEPR